MLLRQALSFALPTQYLKQYLWFRCSYNLYQTRTKVQKYWRGWKDGPHGKSKYVCNLDKGLALDFMERITESQNGRGWKGLLWII